ncbi:hypothetical protein [Gordonia amicalis]|uniref:hypothetical protein n=1 Tax=Gordonia amicalis TaxID=89053 RepID=UPI0024B90397|nr:hypothetical protein [Gordonia amicalis]MDJ0454095.1 hypothetical protein [Gordonia amicalis]MDV7077239.1 hypothetical protein [Gordonia amicalis]
MENTIKRTIAGAAITAAGIGGSLGVSALTAAPAQAKVDSGVYTVRSTNLGITSLPGKAVVRSNRLIIPGAPSLVLHPTPRGAYSDFGIVRYTFTKRSNGYSGKILTAGIQTGTITLNER